MSTEPCTTKARIDLVGGLGSGKSTLAHALAPHGYDLYLETIEGNPFLARCYAGDEGCMFPSQVWFIQKKTEEIVTFNDKGGKGLFDQSLLNTRAYIDVTLEADPQGQMLMHGFVDWVEDKFGFADLYLVLDVTRENQLDRIKWRGRSMEKTVDMGFVSALQERLDYYIGEYQACGARVAFVDTNKVLLTDYEQFASGVDGLIGRALR